MWKRPRIARPGDAVEASAANYQTAEVAVEEAAEVWSKPLVCSPKELELYKWRGSRQVRCVKQSLFRVKCIQQFLVGSYRSASSDRDDTAGLRRPTLIKREGKVDTSAENQHLRDIVGDSDDEDFKDEKTDQEFVPVKLNEGSYPTITDSPDNIGRRFGRSTLISFSSVFSPFRTLASTRFLLLHVLTISKTNLSFNHWIGRGYEQSYLFLNLLNAFILPRSEMDRAQAWARHHDQERN